MSADVPHDDRDEAPRPWEGPGAVRRDVAPHRGNWLRVLGTVALACGTLSFFLVVPALVGLPLGIAAAVMARRDLGRMRSGAMDPAGWASTVEGKDSGAAGALMSAACGILLLLALLLGALLVTSD